jgi:hypothetical protein
VGAVAPRSRWSTPLTVTSIMTGAGPVAATAESATRPRTSDHGHRRPTAHPQLRRALFASDRPRPMTQRHVPANRPIRPSPRPLRVGLGFVGRRGRTVLLGRLACDPGRRSSVTGVAPIRRSGAPSPGRTPKGRPHDVDRRAAAPRPVARRTEFAQVARLITVGPPRPSWDLQSSPRAAGDVISGGGDGKGLVTARGWRAATSTYSPTTSRTKEPGRHHRQRVTADPTPSSHR